MAVTESRESFRFVSQSGKTMSTPSLVEHNIIAPRVTNFQRLLTEIILLSSILMTWLNHI